MKPTFKNIEAQKLYNEMSADRDVYQHGVDNHGKIYFAYLNGNVQRYTRQQFLKIANGRKDFREFQQYLKEC